MVSTNPQSCEHHAFDFQSHIRQARRNADASVNFIFKAASLSIVIAAFLFVVAFQRPESPNTTNHAGGKSKPNENRNPVFQSFDAAGAALSKSPNGERN